MVTGANHGCNNSGTQSGPLGMVLLEGQQRTLVEGPQGPALGDNMGIKMLEEIVMLDMIPQGWNGERQGMRQ